MNDIAKSASGLTRRLPVASPGLLESPMGLLWQGFNDGFERLLGDLVAPAAGTHKALAPLPALELRETDTGYELSAELPGLASGDVTLEVAGGVLSLSGDKREESERKENGCLISERRYGACRRQIALPNDIDGDAIAADFKNGVLSVKMPRRKDALPRARKIEVKG